MNPSFALIQAKDFIWCVFDARTIGDIAWLQIGYRNFENIEKNDDFGKN